MSVNLASEIAKLAQNRKGTRTNRIVDQEPDKVFEFVHLSDDSASASEAEDDVEDEVEDQVEYEGGEGLDDDEAGDEDQDDDDDEDEVEEYRRGSKSQRLEPSSSSLFKALPEKADTAETIWGNRYENPNDREGHPDFQISRRAYQGPGSVECNDKSRGCYSGDLNNVTLAGPSVGSASVTPDPTTTQLLLCPVCSRAFKLSKNQNSNLRRHLKNIHNMSPSMHPRKCKWDSIPNGRVKDDKDREERTRKTKRLWARKERLRRKTDEAALGLCMLNQAVQDKELPPSSTAPPSPPPLITSFTHPPLN
ncbi:hypothetical protein BGZ97_004686 [Linnemannia gamsii]|uniref:Uncharacterized protein n=1 Tax=Linnemannia gamsii TaxID=64522 RepID=A0A9P6QRF9_9FUNG|nr:hypothetical protein BGZ97_004686 [Linnemannia gamsii]